MELDKKTRFIVNGKAVICLIRGVLTISETLNTPMIFDVKGVAKANPEDEFDEIIGSRIAESRALRNLYGEIKLALTEFIRTNNIITKEAETALKRIEKKSENERAHLDKLRNQVNAGITPAKNEDTKEGLVPESEETEVIDLSEDKPVVIEANGAASVHNSEDVNMSTTTQSVHGTPTLKM